MGNESSRQGAAFGNVAPFASTQHTRSQRDRGRFMRDLYYVQALDVGHSFFGLMQRLMDHGLQSEGFGI